MAPGPEQTIPHTVSFSPRFSELAIERLMLERDLGYRKGPAPEPVRLLIDEILPEVPSRVTLQCGFRILQAGTVRIDSHAVDCGTVQFSTGPIIARQLKKSIALAVYVASAGPGLEQWSHSLMADGDMMKGYLVDAMGSEVVERTADWLEKRLIERIAPLGWSSTNRYSPGYCDWHVAEQHSLFSLLPEQFCGITLTPSALMVPIKSISGIIGLGPDVQRGAYQCSICELKDCFRRSEEPELTTEQQ